MSHHEVAAALLVRSNKILLGKRVSSRTFYPDVWDVFGGHIEPGEHHEQTLVRELQEELGITATEWTYLDTLDEASTQLTVHLYLVTAWTGSPMNRQPEEHSAIGWFTLAQTKHLHLADPTYPMLFARYLDSE